MEFRTAEIPNLLDSKAYVHNGTKRYESPRTYLEGIIEQFLPYGEENITVEVEKPFININEDGSENVSYPRAKVELKMPQELPGIAGNVVGVVMALDKNKLVAYGGTRVFACTNLTVAADELVKEFKTEDYDMIGSKLGDYIQSSQETLAKYAAFQEGLNDRQLTKTELQGLFSDMFELSLDPKTGIPTGIVTNGFSKMFKSGSIYQVDFEREVGNNLWNVYNSLTQVITDKNNSSSNNKYLYEAPVKTKAITKFFLDRMN